MARNALVELTYIEVEFEPGGKEYVYQSPFMHRRGDLVLVNTYGKLNVAKVLRCSTDTDYDGPVKMIVGIGSLLEDLEQPTPKPQKASLKSAFTRFMNS
jgi:hypothetical protein